MNFPSDEDLWYLLAQFNGVAFVFAFIFLLIWIRLLLMILEDALRSSRSSGPQSGYTLEGTDAFPPEVLQMGIDDTKASRSSPRLINRGESRGQTDFVSPNSSVDCEFAGSFDAS